MLIYKKVLSWSGKVPFCIWVSELSKVFIRKEVHTLYQLLISGGSITLSDRVKHNTTSCVMLWLYSIKDMAQNKPPQGIFCYEKNTGFMSYMNRSISPPVCYVKIYFTFVVVYASFRFLSLTTRRRVLPFFCLEILTEYLPLAAALPL